MIYHICKSSFRRCSYKCNTLN